jgi:lipoprotein-releasing system permease protein
LQGLLITLTGIILGTIVGLGICWLQSETGLIRLDETAYNVSVAPIKVVGWQILLVDVLTFLISFLILLLPSLLVKKIRPVKALRFE